MRFRLRTLFPRRLFARFLLYLIVPFTAIQGIGVYFLLERTVMLYTKHAAAQFSNYIYLLNNLEKDGIPFQKIVSTVHLGQSYSLSKVHTIPHDEGLSIFLVSRDFKYYLGQFLGGRSFYLGKNAVNERPFIIFRSDRGSLMRLEFPRTVLFTGTIYIVLLWLLFSPVFLFFLIFLPFRSQIKPIRSLADASRRLSAKKHPPALQVRGADEVRMAIEAFNSMSQSLEREWLHHRALLDFLSAELAEPLLAIHFHVEMYGKDDVNFPPLRRMLQNLNIRIGAFQRFASIQGTPSLISVPCNSFFEDTLSLLEDPPPVVLQMDASRQISIEPQTLQYVVLRLLALLRDAGRVIQISLSKRGKNAELVLQGTIIAHRESSEANVPDVQVFSMLQKIVNNLKGRLTYQREEMTITVLLSLPLSSPLDGV